MALHLNVVRNLDVTIMEWSGRVTLGEASTFYLNALREALWNGHRKLALDYGDITYQDSSGMAAMVSAFTLASNTGGELVLFDLTRKVHDLLQITKLFTVFKVFDSRDSVIAYFDSKRKPDINVTERRFGPVAIFSIEGSFTEGFGASRVTAAIQAALAGGAESAILLFPQVLDIDRAAAEGLQAVGNEIRNRKGELVLSGVEDRLKPAMTQTGTVDGLPAYKTVDEALKRFGLKVDRSKGRIEVVRAG